MSDTTLPGRLREFIDTYRGIDNLGYTGLMFQAADELERLRFALGDGEGKLTASQLTRRAYELFQKAAKWDEWHEAQNRVETEMPEGWAFVIQCSPGDWDVYLTDPDGERIDYDRDCDTLAQQMNSAVDEARAAA